MSEFRLLTWNVQHAAPARARRQAAWLASQADADVLVLTEVRDAPGGQALVQALGEHGYEVIVPDSSGGEYLVVVAARIDGLEALPVRLGRLPARFAAARVTLGAHRIGVAGLYVPSRGSRYRRNEDKRAFQEAVSAQLPRLTADPDCGPLVVAGDLNVVEPGHQPRYGVFGEWEYRFYTDFAARPGRRLSSTAPNRRRAQLVRPGRQRLPLRPRVRHPPAPRVAARLPLPAPTPPGRFERPRRDDRDPRARSMMPGAHGCLG
ncbi:MAG: endonuclease/exonuclease/phosphatase family protein [Egibacteraceae bacterium]